MYLIVGIINFKNANLDFSFIIISQNFSVHGFGVELLAQSESVVR